MGPAPTGTSPGSREAHPGPAFVQLRPRVRLSARIVILGKARFATFTVCFPESISASDGRCEIRLGCGIVTLLEKRTAPGIVDRRIVVAALDCSGDCYCIPRTDCADRSTCFLVCFSVASVGAAMWWRPMTGSPVTEPALQGPATICSASRGRRLTGGCSARCATICSIRSCSLSFCEAFAEELNRHRRAQRTAVTQAKRDLATVERDIRAIVQAVKDGFASKAMAAELATLEERQEELTRMLSVPRRRRPSIRRWRCSTESRSPRCRGADRDVEADTTAITRIRGLVDRLTIERNGGITVQGNLAAMLTLAHGKKAPGDGLTSVIKVVAGGGFKPPTFGL